MQVLMKQHPNEKYRVLGSMDLLCKEVGVWEPLIVQTQGEKDYIDGYLLMIGKSAMVLIDGIHECHPNLPPTFLKLNLGDTNEAPVHLRVMDTTHDLRTGRGTAESWDSA